MSQSKIIAGLAALVVLYAGLSFFLLGRQSSSKAAKATAVEAPAAGVDQPVAQKKVVQQTVPENVPQTREQPAQSAPDAPEVAVEIGLDGPTFDACGSTGRPRGLNADGDNFLAVKAAPDLKAGRIDKLGPGDEFYICQTSKGGAWTGIVYSAGGGLASNCAVTSPVDRRQSYAGSCRSGWVYSKYVELVAG